MEKKLLAQAKWIKINLFKKNLIQADICRDLNITPSYASKLVNRKRNNPLFDQWLIKKIAVPYWLSMVILCLEAV